ncbi:MAG: sigma-70 family RNA polymerase sigma factor [Chloroflexi bacterium]|nr:sigma-70 family RNA polymerase sigma factor [Chloroflexota bacterium]
MSEIVMDFEKIHTDFRPKIERYLTRLVGASEAEDLTQEVFVKISRALKTFRGESKLSTWVYRIATNTALDRLRDASFKRNVFSASFDSDGLARADEKIAAEAISLDQQLCRKERDKCYRDFVANLPPNYRTVVALSDLEELAANEIADILGLSLDVVKIRLHRGREKLLRALKDHCKPEDWL